MESFIPLISEVGFQVAVTLYLLYRIESKLDMLVQSIQGLPERLKGNDIFSIAIISLLFWTKKKIDEQG